MSQEPAAASAGPTSLIQRYPRRTFVPAVFMGLGSSAVLKGRPQRVRVEDTPVRQEALSDPASRSLGSRTADVAVVLFTD